MTSTALQVFQQHLDALAARDLDAVVASYAPDAILVDTDRVGQGHEHIRAVFAEVLDAAADLHPESTILERDGVVYVSFRAERAGMADLVGTDTFVVEDGLITVHTGFNISVGATSAPAPLRQETSAV